MATSRSSRSRRPCRTARPAFLFFGVFGCDAEVLDRARALIEARFGELHPRGVSSLFDFPDTRVYRDSMGVGLVRRFFVAARRWPQDRLGDVKRGTIEIEDEIRDAIEYPVDRPVNIDPGLINDCRVLLASTKDFSHRMYRGDGIWEEVTLIWQDGGYQPLPWTYADFSDPEYHRFFEMFRDEFLGRTAPDGPPGEA